MNKSSNFSLSSIASVIQLGKGGKKLKSSPTGIEHVGEDELTLIPTKFADPIDDQDGVTLKFFKENALLNWGTPVQTLTDLSAIIPIERRDKQIRYVEDQLAYYQFDVESLAVIPNAIDPLRVILPDDILIGDPGRWIWTRGRVEQHQDLLGLPVGDDHPQYQLRVEKDEINGYPSLDANKGINVQASDGLGGWIGSILRSIAQVSRIWNLPDNSGTIALDFNFIGATDVLDGNKGLVPKPIIGDERNFLKGDGSWKPMLLFYNTNIKVSDYTAKPDERVLVDSSIDSIVITLPLLPLDGFTVAILDVGNNAGTNKIVIDPTTTKIQDGTDGETWELDIDSIFVSLSYSQVKNSWYFNDIPGTFIPVPSILPTDAIPRIAGDEMFDCALTQNFWKLGGDAIITIQNLLFGQEIDIYIESTGNPYTITWSSGGTFNWENGTLPIPTSSSGKVDRYTIKRIGNIFFGKAILGYA